MAPSLVKQEYPKYTKVLHSEPRQELPLIIAKFLSTRMGFSQGRKGIFLRPKCQAEMSTTSSVIGTPLSKMRPGLRPSEILKRDT